jgi:ParB family chromosome partitioning protein
MTAKKKRLGRGLEALLSKPVEDTASVTGTDRDALKNIPLEHLQKGRYQPRVDMRQDTLEDLANSIKAQGVVQPIVARPLRTTNGDTQRYEIVAGERRWRAAQMAGLADIPTVIRIVPDDAAIAMALIENIQRENLNPLEEARALDRLIKEFKLTHQEAADAVGRSRVSVSNLLRLLDLSDRVMALLESRQIEMGHARALLAINETADQLEAARQVIKNQLSVRDTERLVRRLLSDKAGKKTAKAQSNGNADIRRLEVEITDKLGARVRIDHSQKGSGKLVIQYNSLDELDGILKHIK